MAAINFSRLNSRIIRAIKYPILLLLYQFGIRQKKIFAIGFNKCGTTSLHSLFQSLGLSSYHGTKWRTNPEPSFFLLYDCFSDGRPSGELAKLAKLDELFPGSKFILQVRELNNWVYSRLEHIERQKQENPNKARSQYWDETEEAVKLWIKNRNNYHSFVLSYFSERPSDLLIVNYIRDELAAEKICHFLGYDCELKKPKKNVAPKKNRSLKHRNLLINSIESLGIHESETEYDILCPSLIDKDSKDSLPLDTSELKNS
ncbi:hypothetical protein [Acaryochloris sp. IP29b_bin.137]|uniref:hypothetical protein n=1 Tax=Acaryochloris sp. IP29b_bin.137 TaxID=2969217 RepID=UPI00260674DE|nr:hypothetical protein [Acaryochloris sp. IP29b_bin.137]